MLHGLSKDCYDLVYKYVNGEITLEKLRSSYFDRYLNSTVHLDGVLFDILDSFYAVLDLYTDDPLLLSENPKLYLDENRVKEEARYTFDKLNEIDKFSSV